MPIKLKHKVNWLQIAIGLIALAIGVALYVYDRPPSQIYFVPEIFSQYEGKPSVFGFIGDHLPTFLHVFAFCLISVGILGSAPKEALVACLFWLIIDGIFEIAQHQDIAIEIVPYIPSWFDGIPILENTADYFLQGRYDALDLVAIIVGAVSAYLLIFFMHTRNPDKYV